MNRLSGRQLAAAALVTDAFTLFCLRGGLSAVSAAGFLAGALVQLLALLPVIGCISAGGGLFSSGRIVSGAAVLLLIGWGGALFAMLWRTSGVVFIPWESHGPFGELLVGAALAGAALYVTSGGLRTLGRCAAVAAVIGGLCLLGLMLSAAASSEVENLAIDRTADSFPHELLRGLSLSGGPLVISSMAELTGESPKRSVGRYFAGKAILGTSVILTSVLVAGGVMELAGFPVVMAAQLSQPFSSQRIDSLFLIVFSVCGVFGAAALAAPAAELTGRIFPKLRRFRSVLVLAPMLAAGLFFAWSETAGRVFTIGTPAAVFLLSAVVWLKRRAGA